MKKIIGYNIVKAKTNELLVSIEIENDEVIERDGYKVIPFYEEENHTIEQNAGENRIEGGVVSISDTAKVYTCKDCLRYQFCYLAEKRKDEVCTKISLCKETEKQYRPFNDCNELIEHYQKKYKSSVGCDLYFPSLYNPIIWLKKKEDSADK